MRIIRKSVFETNSSSSHSISVKRNKTGKYDYNLPKDKSNKIPLVFGVPYDFGWGVTLYNDSYTKLNYLICMAVETHQMNMRDLNRPLLKEPEEILNIKDVKKIAKVIKDKINWFNGFAIGGTVNGIKFTWDDIFFNFEGELCLEKSIDHQSFESYRNIDEFLKYNKITIENFLFNPKVTLIISNDNM